MVWIWSEIKQYPSMTPQIPVIIFDTATLPDFISSTSIKYPSLMLTVLRCPLRPRARFTTYVLSREGWAKQLGNVQRDGSNEYFFLPLVPLICFAALVDHKKRVVNGALANPDPVAILTPEWNDSNVTNGLAPRTLPFFFFWLQNMKLDRYWDHNPFFLVNFT